MDTGVLLVFNEYVEVAKALLDCTAWEEATTAWIAALDKWAGVPLVILAPPGTGKTQSAFVMARALHNLGRELVYYPLGDNMQDVYKVACKGRAV